MKRSLRVGMMFGALLALGLAIGYDTSSNVAALEGSHAHLKFAAIVWITVAGGVVGGLAGLIFGD